MYHEKNIVFVDNRNFNECRPCSDQCVQKRARLDNFKVQRCSSKHSCYAKVIFSQTENTLLLNLLKYLGTLEAFKSFLSNSQNFVSGFISRGFISNHHLFEMSPLISSLFKYLKNVKQLRNKGVSTEPLLSG